MMVTTCASNPGDRLMPGVVKPPEGAVGEDDEQAPATMSRKGHRRGRRPILYPLLPSGSSGESALNAASVNRTPFTHSRCR